MASPFSDISDKISGWFKRIWDAITSEFNRALVILDTILDVKAKVKEDFQALIEFAKEATKDEQDFVGRIENLKKSLIRADVAFQIVNDIRTGELKRFVTDVFGEIDGTLEEMLQTVHDTASQFRSLSNITNISGILIRILGVWVQIQKVVSLLNEIRPVLDEISAKLKGYEDIILPQNRPKVKVKDPGFHYSRRG